MAANNTVLSGNVPKWGQYPVGVFPGCKKAKNKLRTWATLRSYSDTNISPYMLAPLSGLQKSSFFSSPAILLKQTLHKKRVKLCQSQFFLQRTLQKESNMYLNPAGKLILYWLAELPADGSFCQQTLLARHGASLPDTGSPCVSRKKSEGSENKSRSPSPQESHKAPCY